MTHTSIFFGGILFALVLGTRLKINIGLAAAAVAFPVGILAGGMSAGAVVSLFPTTLFFNFLVATFLFGFAGSNGALKALAEHLLYACRNAGWLLGLLFFLVTVVIAAMGAGGSAPFFLSAICFSTALQAGINPLLASLAVWMGSMVGGSVPWTSGFATSVGQLEIYFSPEAARSYAAGYYIWKAVFYTALYILSFLVMKGYKVKRTSVRMEKPKAFDSRQKRSLSIIGAVIALFVLPGALKIIWPTPVMARLSQIFSFQMVAVVGIIANIIGNTASYDSVVKERIPWDTLLMLSLTGMYMALANPLGIVEFMGSYLQNSVPAAWIIPGVVLIMCVLSFFVSGVVVIPMMLPMLPVLAEVSSVSVEAVYCAAQIGLTASSISPFSQGGASVLTGCTDDSLRRRLIKQQILLSGVFSAIAVATAFLGGFSML